MDDKISAMASGGGGEKEPLVKSRTTGLDMDKSYYFAPLKSRQNTMTQEEGVYESEEVEQERPVTPGRSRPPSAFQVTVYFVNRIIFHYIASI